jgi:sugar phosphate isomerase/epimerase
MAYLTACDATAPEAVRIAARLGYAHVGLRLWPNAPGTPYQHLIDQPEAMRETVALLRDTGVGVFDLEIIRIGEGFKPLDYKPLFEAGAALGARAVLVAGDDTDPARLADSYARLCQLMQPYGISVDLEFMPWTAVPNARAALSVIEAAGRPPNAGILVDALHFDRSATTLDDLRALPRRLLHYAQICDAPGRTQHGRDFTAEEMIHTARCERLQPGEGGIDLAGLFAALPADLPVSVEVVHLERMRAMDPAEWARQCLEASRRFVA